MKHLYSLAVAAVAVTLLAGCMGGPEADPGPSGDDPLPSGGTVVIDPSVALDTQMKDALSAGDVGLVEALLDAGLDPSSDLGGGTTALHRAAAGDLPVIIATLIDAGADVDALADNRQTPLMIAASLGSGETVVALLEGGADPLISNPRLEGMTALHYAAWQGNTDALAALLDAGVDVDLVDGRETTAIMYTTFLGQPEAAALLIARGCDLNHRDNDGMTALFWARYHEFPEIAQAIEAAGGVE